MPRLFEDADLARPGRSLDRVQLAGLLVVQEQRAALGADLALRGLRRACSRRRPASRAPRPRARARSIICSCSTCSTRSSNAWVTWSPVVAPAPAGRGAPGPSPEARAARRGGAARAPARRRPRSPCVALELVAQRADRRLQLGSLRGRGRVQPPEPARRPRRARARATRASQRSSSPARGAEARSPRCPQGVGNHGAARAASPRRPRVATPGVPGGSRASRPRSGACRPSGGGSMPSSVALPVSRFSLESKRTTMRMWLFSRSKPTMIDLEGMPRRRAGLLVDLVDDGSGGCFVALERGYTDPIRT